MNLVILTVMYSFSLITDFFQNRIKNLVIIISIASGFYINFLSAGAEGLIDSASGAAIPFILLFGLFALKMLGAGDVKLFCATGALMGLNFVLLSLTFSFLSGGLIAAAIIIRKRNAKERVLCFLNYVKTCFLTCSFLPYEPGDSIKDGSRFPFTGAAACGTLITVLYSAIK